MEGRLQGRLKSTSMCLLASTRSGTTLPWNNGKHRSGSGFGADVKLTLRSRSPASRGLAARYGEAQDAGLMDQPTQWTWRMAHLTLAELSALSQQV